MKKIDAVGQACPMPVILTKRALKESNGEAILISVDNEIATQNLAKMACQSVGSNCDACCCAAHKNGIFMLTNYAP